MSTFLVYIHEAPSQSKRKDLDDNIIKLILDYGKEYDYKIFIMLSTLLTTGIRVGELCAIKWDDFDINFDYIRINESLTDYRFENVFLNKRGRAYNSSTFDKRFKFLKELITDKTGIDITYVTPHYFRHTFATKGLQNGVDIKDMQELMGHANAKTLLQVYSHTNSQRKIKSMEKINNSISYAF